MLTQEVSAGYAYEEERVVVGNCDCRLPTTDCRLPTTDYLEKDPITFQKMRISLFTFQIVCCIMKGKNTCKGAGK